MYAIDIDSTIAIDQTGCAQFLNRSLGLGIPDATLASLDGYWQFTELEAVQAFRAHSEKVYQAALKQSDHDPDVLSTMEPLPGAVAGVKRLALHDQVLYVTCRRKASLPVTQDWLARCGFPSPERTVSCGWYHWKYVHAHDAASAQEPIVLIDDMMETIIRSFGRVAREQTQIAISLLRRLEVVGFGLQSLPALPEHIPFAHSLLASWDNLESWLCKKKERDSRTAGSLAAK